MQCGLFSVTKNLTSLLTSSFLYCGARKCTEYGMNKLSFRFVSFRSVYGGDLRMAFRYRRVFWHSKFYIHFFLSSEYSSIFMVFS